ncbi:MAG: AHH domain-containing protein [Desulfovibrionaceae bacterium]|nr:AHH domain-containing protein [Desulfovibrionaceae bacterium]
MADYLTEKTTFICICYIPLAVPLLCSEQTNRLVTYKNSLVLTSGARLKALPLCPLQTFLKMGIPVPCQPPSSAWKLVDHTHIINGSPALTSHSFTVCQKPGMPPVLIIPAVRPDTMFRFISGLPPFNVTSSYKDSVATSKNAEENKRNQGREECVLSAGKTEQEGHIHSKSNILDREFVDSVDFAEEKSQIDKKSRHINQCSHCSDEEFVNSVEGTEAKEQIDQKNKHIYKCSSCSRRKSCKNARENVEIDWEQLSLEVENNSQKLRKNYENYLRNTENPSTLTSADIAYKKSQEELEKNKNSENENDRRTVWKYAAHHVISGNQIFKTFENLVKIAHACKYDINSWENCIMLACNYDQLGELVNFEKSVSAFDVMSIAKMQWHVGGHSYKFSENEIISIRENIKKDLHRERPIIKNYMECVKSEIRKIDANLDIYNICPDAFIKRMNACSKRIREKLAAFRERRSYSYPYYVSHVAYCFAFDLPRRGKLAVIRPNGRELLLERFHYLQPRAGSTLQFSQILDDMGAHFCYTAKRENDVACIRFLQNIELFVLLDGACDNSSLKLPFMLDKEDCFSNTSGGLATLNFLNSNASRLRLWLNNSEHKYYIAPMAKIRERINALDSQNF